MRLKGEKATQESEKETPSQTLKDIEFPEIPRRLLLCLRKDFIIYYFPLFELKKFFCAGGSGRSAAPVQPHCPLLNAKRNTSAAPGLPLLCLLPKYDRDLDYSRAKPPSITV